MSPHASDCADPCLTTTCAASDREQLLAKIAELEAQVQKQKEEVADSGPSIDLERILDQALARQVAEMG